MAQAVPFAIEINEYSTRIADARFKNGVVFLQALGSSETVPSFFASADSEVIQQKQAHVIHTIVSDLHITNKHVNVVIPDTVTYAQIVETPILNEKDLITAIRYQADEFIPMNIDDVYLDLEILKTDQEASKLSILIVAAPKKMVNGIYRTLEFAGLIPQRLETEISAIGRLISEIMKTRNLQEGYCILNVGYSGSSIYVIDNVTSSLVFHRSCKIGFELILRELMTNMNVNKDKAAELLRDPGPERSQVAAAVLAAFKELSQEVMRIVEVYTHRFNLPVTRIFTINYSSHFTDFGVILHQLSNFDVQTLPVNTVYVPNPVVKAFSTEITGFASAVSSILV
jgi:type IV pilus assembly protein PilM